MSRSKKALIGLLVLGALASFSSGTFASFTAQTQSTGNSFQFGTLTMGLGSTGTGGNTTASTSTCNSYGTLSGSQFTNGNANTSCAAVLTFGSATQADPTLTSDNYADLTVTNSGTITASSLTLAFLSSSVGASCANGQTPGTAVYGSGSLCNKMPLTVEQDTTSGFTTASYCYYGTGATPLVPTSAACTVSASDTLGAIGVTPITINLGGGLAPGASVYLKIDVQTPANVGNTYQGIDAGSYFNFQLGQ